MQRSSAISSLLCMFAGVQTTSAQWTQRAPIENTEQVRGAVWDGSKFVLAGGFGFVATSTDGTRWTKKTVAGNPNFLSLATDGKGLFVALDDQGYAWASPDAEAWRRSDSSLGTGVGSIDWTGSRFRISPAGNTSMRGANNESQDGLHWSLVSSAFSTPFHPHYAFDSKLELVAPYLQWKRVEDGLWQKCSTGTKNLLFAVAKNLDTWVAVGDSGTVVRSADGETWSQGSVGEPRNLRGLGFHKGLWIAVGDSFLVYTSPDALVWTRRAKARQGDIRSSGFLWPRIVSDSTRIVALASQDSRFCLTSADGISWTEETIPGDGDAFGPDVYLDPLLLSSGKGILLVRQNGTTAWREGNNPWVVSDTTPRVSLETLAHQNGIWIAGGNRPSGDPVIWRSTDGLRWAAHPLVFQHSYSKKLEGIHAANGWFIASAYAGSERGTNLFSTDGLDWVEASGTLMNKIATNGTVWVSISRLNTELAVSSDGRNWKTISTGLRSTWGFNDIQWNGREFVAVGYGNILSTSKDGLQWSTPPSADFMIGNITGLAWNGKKWVLAASSGSAWSEDGEQWTTVGNYPGNYLTGTALGETILFGGPNMLVQTYVEKGNWTSATITPPSTINDQITEFHRVADTLWALTNALGKLTFTTDAKTWTRDRFTGNAIRAMDHSDSLIVATGSNSNIWTRPNRATDVGIRQAGTRRPATPIREGGILRIPLASGLRGILFDLRGRKLSEGVRDGTDLVFDLGATGRGTLILRLLDQTRAWSLVVATP